LVVDAAAGNDADDAAAEGLTIDILARTLLASEATERATERAATAERAAACGGDDGNGHGIETVCGGDNAGATRDDACSRGAASPPADAGRDSKARESAPLAPSAPARPSLCARVGFGVGVGVGVALRLGFGVRGRGRAMSSVARPLRSS
jgi:hypothetical protein